MPRLAFTLIELIFVIIIVSILSVVMVPRLKSNDIQEATDQVIKHMRYAQHLALHEDMYLPEASLSNKYTDSLQQAKETRQWFKQWWQIQFHTSTDGDPYSIYSDHPTTGTADQYGADPDYSTTSASDAIAKDPLTGLYIVRLNTTNAVPDNERLTNVYVGDKYGVSISMTGCSQDRILFDYIGRPHCGITQGDSGLNPFIKLATTQIQVNLTNGTESTRICVEPESGYIHQCL